MITLCFYRAVRYKPICVLLGCFTYLLTVIIRLVLRPCKCSFCRTSCLLISVVMRLRGDICGEGEVGDVFLCGYINVKARIEKELNHRQLN